MIPTAMGGTAVAKKSPPDGKEVPIKLKRIWMDTELNKGGGRGKVSSIGKGGQVF